MAYLELTLNTSRSQLGFLSPLDLELAAAVVDIFYVVCLRDELRLRPSVGQSLSARIPRSSYPRRNVITREYDVEIKVINFSNPLTIGAFLKNITVGTAQRILDRTIFYNQERDRRAIHNDIERQKLITQKLNNVQKAVAVRKKLINSGFSEEDATKVIGSVLLDEGATLKITQGR
jgi:hypothetical protein